MVPGELLMEINSHDQEDGYDGCGHPIHHEAERRPPPRVLDVMTAVLPKVFNAVTNQADYDEPG
jgi:hypothetical protein